MKNFIETKNTDRITKRIVGEIFYRD